MAGKTQTKAQMYVGKQLTQDLNWLIRHLRASDGIHVYKTLSWDPHQSDVTIYADACQSGMGLYVPHLSIGFYSPVTKERPTDGIFFFEAVAVCSALHWSSTLAPAPRKLTIFTDNMNTVNIFGSLRATPVYNPILKSSVDIRIQFDIDLQVLHVPGELNTVADAISRSNFDYAASLVPNLIIHTFQPPQDALGAAKK
jgi:hypothetical protein